MQAIEVERAVCEAEGKESMGGWKVMGKLE
jgi:hypothetical protein